MFKKIAPLALLLGVLMGGCGTGTDVISYNTLSPINGTTASPGASPVVTPTPISVTSLSISAANQTMPVNSTQQLSAVANLTSGGTNVNVTSLVTWQSSNTSVATVNSLGLLTAVGAGNAVVNATSGNVTSNNLTFSAQ